VLEGEVAAMDASGCPSSTRCETLAHREYRFIYFVFAVLMLAGRDLIAGPSEVLRF
jgi:hypothetical protein